MTNFPFDDTIPAAANDPSNDQPLMLQNNASTKGIIGQDHITFGLANGGYHTIIHFSNQGSDPGAIGGVGQAYTKTVSGDQQLFYESGNGVVTQLSGTITLLPKAAVSFNGRSSNGSATINYSSNVSNVTRTAQGFYRITFSSALSSANYYCTMIARPAGSANTNLCQLTGGSPQTSTQVFVNFLDSSLNDVDPTVVQFMAFM
jgi:hypothetical protein